MLGGQAVLREKHPHPAGPSQPGGQLAVAAKRPEPEASAVQEEEHPAGVRFRGFEPVGWHPAGGHLRHQHVVGYRMKAARGGEGGAELFQRGRGRPCHVVLSASCAWAKACRLLGAAHPHVM